MAGSLGGGDVDSQECLELVGISYYVTSQLQNLNMAADDEKRRNVLFDTVNESGGNNE